MNLEASDMSEEVCSMLANQIISGKDPNGTGTKKGTVKKTVATFNALKEVFKEKEFSMNDVAIMAQKQHKNMNQMMAEPQKAIDSHNQSIASAKSEKFFNRIVATCEQNGFLMDNQRKKRLETAIKNLKNDDLSENVCNMLARGILGGSLTNAIIDLDALKNTFTENGLNLNDVAKVCNANDISMNKARENPGRIIEIHNAAKAEKPPVDAQKTESTERTKPVGWALKGLEGQVERRQEQKQEQQPSPGRR